MKNSEIIKAWIDAFNSKNIEALLALYEDGAIHSSPRAAKISPETGGILTGAVLKKWWTDAFERLPDLRYELRSEIGIGDHGIEIEYMRYATGEEPSLVREFFVMKGGKIICSEVC